MERRSLAKSSRSPPTRTVAKHFLETKNISRNRRSSPVHSRFHRERQIRGRPTTESLCPSTREIYGFGLARADSVRPRYPNYLPELKARRAVATRCEQGHRRTSSARPDMRDNINDELLRGTMNITDTRIVPYSPGISAIGQPLKLPPKIFTMKYPRVLLSLYRTPEETVREWESGSPMIQLDNMRHGHAVGPSISQLPSPESSHAVLLSIRGKKQDRLNPHH